MLTGSIRVKLALIAAFQLVTLTGIDSVLEIIALIGSELVPTSTVPILCVNTAYLPYEPVNPTDAVSTTANLPRSASAGVYALFIITLLMCTLLV